MAQTVGIIDAYWRDRKIAAEKGSKFKMGGLKNNAVVLGRQVHRSQEMEASEITVVTSLLRGQRLTDLYGDGSEGELQILLDTGQTYIFPDAFLTNRPEVTGGEGGKVELVWMAGEGEELLNG
ncbi:phage tail tube protein [Falsiroseomonas sp.]|uniref:phage tail tube protein n=1 Tax=Falsiroseomonas sp. TaxID=2870721 RepID=UPI003F707949